MRSSQSAVVGIVVAIGFLVGCGGGDEDGAGSVPETVASTAAPVETTEPTTESTTESTTGHRGARSRWGAVEQ